MNSIKNKIGLILIIFIGISIVPFNVLAKNKSNGQWKSQGKDSNDSAADKACYNDLHAYGLLHVKKKDDGKYVLTVSSETRAQWDIRYIVTDADDTTWDDIMDNNGNFKEKTTYIKYYDGNGISREIDRTDENQAIYVVAIPRGTGGHVYAASSDEKSTNLLESSYTVKENDKDVTKTTTCKTGSVKINDQNKIVITNTGAVLKKTIIAKPVTQKKTLSDSAQRQCEAMKAANYKVGADKNYFLEFEKYGVSAEAAKTAYNHQMRESFPYCYGDNYEYDADYTIKAKDIKLIRQKSLEAFYHYYRAKENEKKNNEYKNLSTGNYTKLENLDEKKFSCEANNFMEQTSRYYYEIKSTIEAKTSIKWYCRITCRENYEIKYSPPQEVKSGLCFNYTVTIKSKVACKTEINPNFKWPKLSLPSQKQCVLSPICDNDASETQAGPNEKFDSCISSCDGGKYTQKCIDSCYNKVYDKKNKATKTTSKNTKQKSTLLNNTNNNKNNVIKLANDYTSDPYKKVEGCTSVPAIQGNWSGCAEAFSKLKREYPMGYYNSDESGDWPKWVDLKWHPCFKGSDGPKKCQYENSDGKTIKYTIGSYNKETYFMEKKKDGTEVGNMDFDTLIDNIKRSSPYYFATKTRAEKTLKSFYAVETGYNGNDGKRFYVIDNSGIKRQHSTTYHCTEKCGFSLDGSDNEDINGKEIVDCRGSKSGYTVGKYITNLEQIADGFRKCTAADSCAEDTASFEIKVDEKRGKNEKECSISNAEHTSRTGNNKKNEKYKCPNDESQYEANFKNRPDLIFKPLDSSDLCYGVNGKCYKIQIPGDPYYYKTTITTPGSWIAKKTGAVTYDDKRTDDKYRAKDTKYCTRYDTCDVNEEWAGQVQAATTVHSDGTSEIDATQVTKTDGITENITAKIGRFGKYGASFELSCFYGVKLPPDLPTGKGEKCYKDDGTEVDCTSDKDIPNGGSTKFKESYDIRIASNETIFPQKANGKIRLRGYNWGSQATLHSNDLTIQSALQNTGYGVDPVTYSTKVMNKGQSIYDDAADMTITISKSQMTDLKKYNYKIIVDGDNYTKVDDIPGLYYYMIPDKPIDENVSLKISDLIVRGPNWILGNNSETAKEAMN